MKKSLFWSVMIATISIYVGLSFFGTSWQMLFSSPTPDTLMLRVEILKSITEGIAIIIAGIWTYEVYIKNRYDHPYPKIQQQVKFYNLEDDFNYLSVFVTVTNEGKTKLDLGSGIIYVRKVLPLSPTIKNLISSANLADIQVGRNMQTGNNINKLFIDQSQRIGWTTLGERTWKENLRGKMHEFEPGQTREIQFDFLLKDKVDVVEVISYFELRRTGHWEYVTLHSLN